VAVRLLVLGSNGTYPTPGRPCSGYLVEAGATVLMLDAGPGTVMALQAADAVARLSALLVTHLHPDHCADVFALFNLLRMGPEPRSGIPALGPAGLAAGLARFLGAGEDHSFHRVFDWQTVAAGDRVGVGDLELEFGLADHQVPTLIVSIGADGRRLVYSADTGPGGDLAALSTGADLLLCEATFQGEQHAGGWPYHLSAAGAGALAREAGVRRLLLTHLGPMLEPERSVAEAAAVFGGPVEWAAPGLEVEV
jgi:ribonuclease BN (tRNA processing enzyme)